ncbi:YhcN/YlaJ family sporulation lipoprotein [Bacillus licheniformis]|uniref:YhcN/YlaJ family sporulation lipoprotein n=1 Tax=Bacillus licheniformis TaxID=1402 RepID=A0A1Y0YEL1_BACLI|nr:MULTISPECIES: YhcN/YlaJ family sporulation lipoprotein [Bacillus]KUL16389.1 sporulation lipoprotein YlaJ [Bacillus licheniformis LMG 6934]MBJ7887255.1 YhcN/YlaJ family sporulation lipoprotein [Bacillaceae bacterium HSR45]MBY8346362.1 YhcN/YlaJ family sporulation lipoprotein [Bacillus sp. PCH94]MDP4081034.1 YhcN/YlaJ family sporulation lipoprotein [Bacillota bacterium]NBB42750.1 YhcN/YlaJ family sporulation lipoprotein [Bacillus sp. y1(2019)]
MRIFFLILIQTVMLLSACGIQNNARNEANELPGNRPIHVKNSAQEPVNREDGQAISRRLVKITESVPGVNDATAVVLGRLSVVGIDVKDNLERSKVESIKYSVAEALQNDPYGANAAVVADPDTVNRLRAMGREIQAGRPVKGILDELAAIVGRVLPEVPNDATDNQQTNPTKSNNDQLNERNQKQLEKKQNNQSNKHMKNRQQ